MNSEASIYEAARQNRDPRFDGRFFVGVLTTGIYCRPVCPVRVPKRENVQLFASAAAASEAGFRPCLRCRPETAPGTPAWAGSSYTVSRALQLMMGNVNGVASVELLADELSISARQLRRLFRQHLGTTPASVLRTKRLHFAKQLLDETSLAIAEVCFASGYGSVRRFNDEIKGTYGKTPRELRNAGSVAGSTGNEIIFRLSFRPPFDWAAMLAFFSRRAIPGVESVGADCYARTFYLHGKSGYYRLVFSPSDHVARLTVNYPAAVHLLEIVERVRHQFDLNADSHSIERHLERDTQLAPLVAASPGLRVPGCWDGLEIAVRAIVGQQVSVSAAATLMSRLVKRAGTAFPMPAVHGADELQRVFPTAGELARADLSGLGITGQRIAAIQSMAECVDVGQLRLDGSQDPDRVITRLCQIKGIGEWTARYISLRALRDPDAFPHGDLILRRALEDQVGPLSAAELLKLSEPWRPWRGYAVMLLWRHYQLRKQESAG